jgi:hypothetical protein
MIAKYGICCIIIRQKIAYCGISFVSNEIYSFYYSHLGRKGLIRAKQYLSFGTKRVPQEAILYYKLSIFGYPKNYKTIYSKLIIDSDVTCHKALCQSEF